MKPHYSERGQALIVIALAIVGITGIVALAVDGGNVFSDRRKAQNAVDAAALASAYARIKGENVVDAVMAAAAENGYNNDGITNVVSLYTPPQDGPHAGDVEYMQVIITSHVNMFFARVIGRSEVINTVEATARTKAAEIKPLLNGAAVASLAPQSDCYNNKAFWVHGEATLDITGGGVFVNSNNQDCALIQQGSGSIRISDGYTIDIVGRPNVQKWHLFTPTPTEGAMPVNYPPPFFLPKLGCPDEAQISEDGTTMSSGSWNGDFPPPGVTHLESGVYCLDHGMHITGDLEGHNVIFKVIKGEVRFNSSANIILDAPNSGPNKGLLIYLPLENRNKVVINGAGGSDIRGTILAPGSPILIKGMYSKMGMHSQIIGYTIEADGNSNIVINYVPENNYQSLSMPEIQLAE